MAEYFRCDPGKYGCNASCCRDNESTPSLTVGDLYRISRKTGERIEDIWKTKGSVVLQMPPGMKNSFFVTPGLFHNPCPYLNGDNQCDIHDSRPISCANFPVFHQVLEGADLENDKIKYDCMEGCEFSSEQIEIAKRVEKIQEAENITALKILGEIFWPIVIEGPSDLKKYTAQARETFAKKDPSFTTMRGMLLKQNIDYVEGQAGMFIEGISNPFNQVHMAPIFHAIYDDYFTEVITGKWNEIRRAVRQTSREYLEVLGGIPF
ncbi:MAG: YkgJ family cysteine cluster protein [Candidatus Aenigmarchaeota archaeon]|nr:YkgJ family cysteine cluster protein [Candidatus Aenigmarchaeota archaeon]